MIDYGYRGSDIDKGLKATAPMLTAFPKFKEFADRGGKLMIYTGWINYHNPKQLIDFYNDAVKDIGAARAANALRLLTIPGQRTLPARKRSNRNTSCRTINGDPEIVLFYRC